VKRVRRALGVAFGYFSILPVQREALLPAPDAAALAALPLVGASIGALSGLSAWIVSLIVPRPFVIATAFGAPIVLSGAIHLDGFLDCSDAVFATASVERRLEIMKDPRHGTYAVAAAMLASAFSLAALATCRPSKLPAILAFSGALARLAAVANALRFPYGRAGVASRAFESKPPLTALILEAGALIVLANSIGPGVWALIPASLVASSIVARRAASRLGAGLTGDVYGFLVFALEPAIIAFAAGMARKPRT
jgi:adenosylcobinamide-GDP ribazoletransferase